MTTAAGLGQRAGRLSLHGVTAGYRGVVALDDVTVDIEGASRVVVVGANGSGKSTLLRCVLGLHQGWQRGAIRLDDTVARTGAEWTERRRRIAWVPQRPATGSFPVTVGELLASSGAPDAARDAAEGLGLGGLHDRPVHRLSGGQLQRVYLARALGEIEHGAGILLADEPTSALDFAGRDEIIDRLATLPVTTVVATHDPAVVARADRVLEMADGALRERPT